MASSEFKIKVLKAIDDANRDRRFTSPSWIANAVFPSDHPGWSRSCKCGAYGSTKGSGLVMMMGGYLGKLRNAKPPLIVTTYGRHGQRNNSLTQAGRQFLKDNSR